MIALLGYAGIVGALVAAGGLSVEGYRVHRNAGRGTRALRPWVIGIVGGALLAMIALEVGLLTHDFSIEYVAQNSARATPLIFTVASAWAALEGSLVLWGLVLAGYTLWVFRRLQDEDELGAGALAVMGIIAIFFFGLMATASNPFTTLDVVPADGTGPNPLLQNNLLMAVHPPLLYLGFVGFSVPFAFAISALVAGQQGTVWLERTHRWNLVAWAFLTSGIAIGALWSYAVLGWGGYWAWDPVENASFIPWLVATAFIHSAIVQRRRGMLQAWNITLVISTFALTILGTFLTRSGVIASVHSFTQSAVGPAIFGFLIAVVVGSLALFALRAHLVASAPRLESLASREGAFLFNNLLLTLFAFVVLSGTIFPILVEAFSGTQVSVGRPFFDRFAVPIAFALLLVMGLGPVTPYRVARGEVVWERIRSPLRISLAVGAVAVLAGLRTTNVVLILMLATFVSGVIIRHLWTLALSARRGPGGIAAAAFRLMRRDPGYWGGQISHIGVAIVAVAIATSGTLAARDTVVMNQGDTVAFEGYTLTYTDPFAQTDAQRAVQGVSVELRRGDRLVAEMKPRINTYFGRPQPVASPSIRVGLTEDVYMSLLRLEPATREITLDVYRFPLMWLLWAGGLLIAAGGFWATFVRKPARRRGEAKSHAARS